MKKILLVDDVKFFLELESTFLKRANCEIFTAHNGKEALEVIAKEEPDLVLMDFHMPKMSGDECCRKIKGNPATKDISVIMVTTEGKPEEQGICRLAGCDDYITKPINRMHFLDKVKKHLDIPIRQHVRVPIEATVTYLVNGESYSGEVGDISEGGMFIESKNPCPAGTKLKVSFNMPGDEDFSIEAQGRIMRVIEKDQSRPVRVNKGMGVKFTVLSAAAKKKIAEYVKTGNYMV